MREQLERCDGPACGRCGCRDTTILQQPQAGHTWWPTGRARCRHCGHVFAYRPEQPPAVSMPVVEPGPTQLPPVTVQQPGPLSTRVDVMTPTLMLPTGTTRCPDCGAVAKAYSTKGRTQYRKCPDCGRRFKTAKEAG